MPEPSLLRKRALYSLYLLAFGALLFLPRLGKNGLWDPSEVRVADAARLANDGHPTAHWDFNQVLVSRGFAMFGMGELGGRLPFALATILLVLAAYWAGRAILRPRAALLGAVVLGTMPAVLFGARQLTTQAPLLLGVTLAVGGLAHLFDGKSALARVLGFFGASAGLALGTLAAGLFEGALAPLLAVTAALLIARPRARGLALAAVTLVVAACAGMILRKRGVYSWWVAGSPRAPQWQTVFTTAIKPLGFATAPWGALLPFAVLRSLDRSEPAADVRRDDASPDRFAQLLLPAWLAAAYFMGTLQDAFIGDLLPPAAPVIALLCGAYLDSLLEDGFGSPLEGVAVGALVFVLGHDILMGTDAFVSVLLAEQIRWPAPVYWTSDVLFGFIAVFGVVIAASFLAPVVWPRKDDPRVPRAQTAFVWGALAVQVLFVFGLAYWFIPVTSQHLSPKELYGKARQLDPKAPLGQYRFTATGASYYMAGRPSTVLATPDDVMKFLSKPERVFIFVGSEELAAVDQATRGKQPSVPYFVIDDSNSHFLIISNQIGKGETDLNPLRRFVSSTAPTPKTPIAINFDDKLKLVGYELPDQVQRGADVKVRLFFQVLAPVGGSFKVFLHFDGPGQRVNGDHVPLDGRFPTQFWTPGTYVIDEFLLKPDRGTEPSGTYQLYFGMFSGDRRLKVKEGASDGENRVKLGAVRVQ